MTVIVGATNAGKSALVRALQAVLFNWSGGGFVREGASKTSVTLAFEGGLLAWVKPRKGGGEYKVWRGDEEITVTRAGRELVPEIQALTGVREVEAEGVRAKLQIEGQFDDPFLLASTGGQAAKLLARVSKLDVLVTAQVRARRDMERARRSADSTAEEAEAARTQLERMPDFDALVLRWNSLTEALNIAQDRVEAVARARQLDAERKRIQESGARWLALDLVGRTATFQVDLQVHEDRSARLAQAQQLDAERKRIRDSGARWQQLGLPARTIAFQVALTLHDSRLRTFRELEMQKITTKRSADSLSAARGQLERSESELHGVLDKLEVCPVCQRPMP